MGKNKLARWAEMKSFRNVIEPGPGQSLSEDYPLKGLWKTGYFGNDNPLVLELGCGKGEYTVTLAKKYPGKNFIGIDIKGARIWRGAKTASEENLLNVLFIRTRIEFINTFFAGDEVDEIWITFPDPFPRPRDEARRLTGVSFLNSYRKFLRDKGIIHLKTDNHQLYRFTRMIAEKNSLEVAFATDDLYGETGRDDIPSIITHYENIFLKEGKKINYLAFRLDKNREIIK